MFYLIAQWIINQGGVVFGAAFDDKLQLRHTLATTLIELKPLMKSKYLQSDTTGVFEQVRILLQQNKMVLFVGTPCQCQALYNYTNKEDDNSLYLIDFICHGVPSQDLFNRFIESYEKRNKVKVKNFIFREKNTSKPPYFEDDIHNYTMEVVNNTDGNISLKTGLYKDCSFYLGFKNYQIFRNSCYDCKFVGRNRITDFTLADFWHLTEYEPEIKDFHKGYSELIVNSQRGDKLFEELKKNTYCKEYGMDIPLQRNCAYVKPTLKHIDRDVFFALYRLMPYEMLAVFWSRNVLVRKCLRLLRKITY
jgi:hypothetical protein